ncbi:MAG TPA: ATP-binding cassette domain-containing protein [Candidatus Thermoplasmatota archaeon]|nr:ATP-binding cassette domain-containing protein [Candidatus Thermoplasmatota archaeon]
MTGPALDVRDFTVTVNGRRLLDGVTLQVAEGEAVLLTGANGSGKSTLLRALAGLLPPNAEVQGSLRVRGLDPLRNPVEAARVTGTLLQHAEHQLLGFTVEEEARFKLENLRIPRTEGLTRAGAALARFGLTRHARRDSATLSGGEAKRAVLAQQWATAPQVLLLDEPLASLDAPSREGLLDALRSLRGEATLLLTEHDPAPLTPLLDRVVCLHEGRITEASAAPRPQRAGAPRRPLQGPPLVCLVDAHLAPAPGARPILEAASLSFPAGFHALLGENGSGKTTVLRALAGLLPPTRGTIETAGIAVSEGPAALAPHVGYLPQGAEDFLTEPTVREEVDLTPRLLGLPTPDAAFFERFGLTPFLDRHPLSLSGGERQRVALAAALAHDPAVVLLDEPTLHLDAAGRHALAELLQGLARKGCLVLAATHDTTFAALADQVHGLHGGALRTEPLLLAVAP